MTAPPCGVDLLDFADDVLSASFPRPAAIRRAISAAYYAVFHELTAAAARRTVGADSGRERDRHEATRWYSHHDVRVVSTWVSAQADGQRLPKSIEPLLDSPLPELIDFARDVIRLQEARVNADYDYTATFTADDARHLVGIARLALTRLACLPDDRVSDNYLMLLLGGPRLPSR